MIEVWLFITFVAMLGATLFLLATAPEAKAYDKSAEKFIAKMPELSNSYVWLAAETRRDMKRAVFVLAFAWAWPVLVLVAPAACIYYLAGAVREAFK